jgi:sulfoacetaldehyde dehydrogenase
VTAAAWAGYSNADRLATLAVQETRIGIIEDKASKNRRKTLGTLRDLKGAKSVGVIRVDETRGIIEIAKPVGIIAALTPLTNPGATPINNIMIALKGRNALILAPHPKAERTCAEVVRLVHLEMAKLGVPQNLVQLYSLRAADKAQSKQRAEELMRLVDLVLVTAGPANVKAAYRSGTPALGVGLGNVPVIVDSSADLEDAADKIVRSKTFDNATSCSSENSLLVQDSIYAPMIDALKVRHGYLVPSRERALLQAVMWPDGALSRSVVAQSAAVIARLAGINAGDARFLIVEEEGIGKSYPFSGEKLSPVLTLYRFATFQEAVDKVNRILEHQGIGHSCGIHTKNEEQVVWLANAVKVCRVLVNQAHCIGNGGDFANSLDFTLSMGAGTWAGNSCCDNITYRHLLNITRIVRTIPMVVPTEEEMFGEYLERHRYRHAT